jgi:UDP-N-acetylmuramate dehydrogenase
LGSNVLIRDGGWPGLVIKIGKGLDQLSHRAGTWKAGGGLPIPILARRTAEDGFAGIHRLIGVPGSVGGGVYMNAGAHGNDFASVLVSATVVQPNGTVAEVPRARIPFAYRRSGLGEGVVLGCALKLEKDDPARLKVEIGELLRRRKAGTPFDQPCCGSVFRNPAENTAGHLIDQCGLKGRRVGGAEISRVHANYIVNRGNASADDVLKLIDIARTAVFKDFGVELELEVKVLGSAK